MDPDEALRKMREALTGARELYDDGITDGATYLYLLEGVAECAEALDEWLSKGGFLPEPWRPDPLAGATYCPDCGTWLDYPEHRDDCPFREPEDEDVPTT